METTEQMLTLAVFTKSTTRKQKRGHGRDRVGRVKEGTSVQTACEQGYKETVGGMWAKGHRRGKRRLPR